MADEARKKEWRNKENCEALQASKATMLQQEARLLWERVGQLKPRFCRSPEKPLFMRTFGVLRKLKNAWILRLTTVCPTSTQKLKNSIQNRGVAQLGARDIWDVEAAGSNPVTPTTKMT